MAAASATTCAAHDATRVSVSADCSQITALRVGALAIDVSGGGVTASLSVAGVPQRHWTGVHGASRYAALTVDAGGGASAWGDNGSGMLDQDLATSALTSLGVATPALSAAGTPFTGVMQATMGERSGAVLLGDGSAQAWGDNGFRELGAASVDQPSLVPVGVDDLAGHATAAARPCSWRSSQDRSAVGMLMDDGAVVSWGDYPGSGNAANNSPPVQTVWHRTA